MAFFNPDTTSTFCKREKNELFKFLKISLGTVSVIPVNTPKTYDGMVLFQKLPATLSTFGDIYDFLINKIVKGSCRIYFFKTYYYLPNFIKSLERKNRSMIGLLRMKVLRRGQKRLQQFDKYLRLSENKIELVRFLINDWSTNTIHAKILEDKELYVTVEDKVLCISSNGNKLSMVFWNRLSNKQEEDDTKLFLCA